MKESEQRAAAKKFVSEWKDRGDEKSDTQSFWLALLRDVFGIVNVTEFVQFEKRVKLQNVSFIDGYIPKTRVLIEQKSADVDIRRGIVQSDKSVLTPFQQAKRYNADLPFSERCRWIVVCNFREFHIYDMDKPHTEPEIVKLESLEKEYYRLKFLVETGNEHIQREMEVSIKAGELVGILYDALLKQYANPNSPETLRSLNILCVRLVFCLYAEDAGIFARRDMFHDYLIEHDARHTRKALLELFKTLDTKIEKRDPYLKDDNPTLAEFPYVNGGLFSLEDVEIPPFSDEIRTILLNKTSKDFDWNEISPTIFGAVFESTLNPETRRKGGMHYTSIENIHKVIDPLFLDDLREEFATICRIDVPRVRDPKLVAFQEKLGSLKFLDPACGSGNFLTETYLSLRRLENDVIRILSGGQSFMDFASPIRVNISQFFGIEINDFAVIVAKTALWIAESQMMRQTEDIVRRDLDFLPLKTNASIIEGNALRMNWQTFEGAEELDVFKFVKTLGTRTFSSASKSVKAQSLPNNPISAGETPAYPVEAYPVTDADEDVRVPSIPTLPVYDYIMGNPPFVGNNNLSNEQRKDVASFFKDNKTVDYVACWYYKTAEFIQNTDTRCAFVSTNSICQGEQVINIWKPIFDKFELVIDFAYRTFRWDSESTLKAHVHCIIVGFSANQRNVQKFIFDGTKRRFVANISPYLLDTPTVFVENRHKPLFNVPEIRKGNQPTDGGNLIIEARDYEEFIKKEPRAIPYIKKLVGAKEFINGQKRYCLWLKNISPAELRKMPLVMERIENVRKMRLASPDAGSRRLADTPHLFRETNNPKNFIIIPSVSSERREYIPNGFLDENTIPTNLVLIIPDATLYHFGVLTSSVHMAWMRAVCGRLEMRYRYSKDIVYNNFPWPSGGETFLSPNADRGFPASVEGQESPSNSVRLESLTSTKIAQTAQGILDARALFPDCSLADLYDPVTMPPELRKAHAENDKAVMEAYGFSPKMSEAEIVAELMKMYQNLVG
ncbi:MAG: methylase [Planctomycetia bacterium]|nr:methylase [Planctomycetia bacterium]